MSRWKKLYPFTVEFGASLAVYHLLLPLSHAMASAIGPGHVRTWVLLAPMVGVILCVWAIARQFRRIDEYERLKSLEDIAIAAGLTMALALGYGFLDHNGFPRLSMFAVWPVMGTVWLLRASVRRFTSRLPA